MRLLKRVLVACVFLAGSRWALAQNTTFGTAANMAMGQKVLTSIGPGSTTQFWYLVSTIGGRSYCAETGNVENSTPASNSEDTVLTIFQGDGTTVITGNDDVGQEPFANHLSRACWVPTVPQSGPNYIRITPFSGPPSAQIVTLRVVETTLFCPWFFVAGDYNAFSLLRNTSGNSLSITVTWRGLSGAVAGTTTVPVPANGTVILNARDFVNPATFSNGSIEVAHAGSPEQIMGSTTTLSGTTGLGFDAMFEQRKPW